MRPLLYERPASRVAETAGVLARHPRLAAAAVTRPVFAWQVSVLWQRMRPLAARAIREHPPHVVAVEHDYGAGWAHDLPADLPAALTFHNLSWRYYESRAAAASRHGAAAVRGRGAPLRPLRPGPSRPLRAGGRGL